MVNTGKPSGGCKLCRARRIKCDEAKPFCMKCLKSKRQCPGYRDPFEGKIRDETQSTIQKVKRTRIVVEKAQVLKDRAFLGPLSDDDCGDIKANAAEWKCGFFDDREGNESVDSSSLTASSNSSSPRQMLPEAENYLGSLVTPVDQQATCYLLSDYVLVSHLSGGRRGFLKFAYRILTEGDSSKCLKSAFKAVSFAALASRPHSYHLMIEAESHYSKALRDVNKAIQDPVQVRSNQTLGAVLLLAFYETLASTRDSLEGYDNHIKGAAQLVKMRGSKQLVETDVGAEMFSMTRNQFLALRGMSASSDPEDYSWLLEQHCGEPFVGRVLTLTIACGKIRSKTDQHLSPGPRNPQTRQRVVELLRLAQVLERKLASVHQPSSAVWSVGATMGGPAASGEEGQGPPGEVVYEFHNLYTAAVYITLWTSHIYLTTCIFRCMAWLAAAGDWRRGEDYEAVVGGVEKRIADIVAATPYCCTWNGYGTRYATFPVGLSAPTAPVKGVAGMVIYRAAFTALVSDYATPEQKTSLHGRLRFLADEVGIKQVNTLLKTQHEFAAPSRDIMRDRLRG